MSGFPGGSVVKNLETWVQPSIQKIPTCHRATEPVPQTTEPVLERLGGATREPQLLKSVLRRRRSHGRGKPAHRS